MRLLRLLSLCYATCCIELTVCFFAAEYITNPVLSSHGFLFHQRYRFFLCVQCQTGVRHLPRHCADHADHRNMPEQTFKELVQQFSPCDESHNHLPSRSGLALMPSIGKLALKQGLACPICPYAMGMVGMVGKKYMKKHIRENHDAVDENDPMHPIQTTAQRLFSTTKSPYIPVREVAPSAVPSPWDIFKSKVMDKPTQSFAREPPARRELISMLRSTGWTDHVKGLDPKELCRLVAPAHRNEYLLEALQEQVFTYFGQALAERSNLPRLLLVHLNSTTREG